ncbi:MAG: glycosyltransferase family 1 protein [Mariprofundales bacterium]
MKILINAINARQGGGQTYLLNLLAHLPDNTEIDAFLLLAPANKFTPMIKLEDANVRVQYMYAPSWVDNPLLRPWWERLVLPKILLDGNFDVLFCPGGVVYTKPPKGCKLVTMFRNMIPFDLNIRQRYPRFGYQRLRNWMLARLMLRSMKAADLVIFISEYAKSVIEKHLNKPLRQVVVIPHGIAAQFRNYGQKELAAPDSLPTRYLLYVSNIDVYKMQVEVVKAFYVLRQVYPAFELVFIGPERLFYADLVRQEISKLDLNAAVHILGTIAYDTLPAVYQNAEINIFASECENCPNILLESMASGRPVVCSDIQPMPEFGGDAVLYFSPSDPQSLANALLLILGNSDIPPIMSEQARQRANNYTWEKTAMRTWAAIAGLK